MGKDPNRQEYVAVHSDLTLSPGHRAGALCFWIPPTETASSQEPGLGFARVFNGLVRPIDWSITTD